MKYTIESGIPIERMNRAPNSDEYAALSRMEVGDSFCVVTDEDARVNLYQRLNTARHFMRRTIPKFDYKTRKVEEMRDGIVVRVWRTA